MEKRLTQKELLENLIRRASDPFTTSEQKYDIFHVLSTSSNFKGMNHLFLVDCYFSNDPLFDISMGKALQQAYLALEENNSTAYYYLFLLEQNRNPQKARNFLRMATHYQVPKAFLEIGDCYHTGHLFEKDNKRAFSAYQEAIELGQKEGYYKLLLLASEEQDVELEKKIYEEAKKHGVELPGVIE